MLLAVHSRFKLFFFNVLLDDILHIFKDNAKKRKTKITWTLNESNRH